MRLKQTLLSKAAKTVQAKKIKARTVKPVIVIDTREKRPYVFNSSKFGSVKKALPSGDYSLEGLEDKIAIERKSLSDFISTLVHNRERFDAELKRLSSFNFSWIVVEGSIKEILSGDYRSLIKPKSLLGITTSIMVDFPKTPIVFCDDRPCAAAMVEALMLRCYKRM